MARAAKSSHARAVIIALAHDSTTIFTTTVIRNFAPEVPIFARVDRVKNVGRIHKAGADFVLSTSQVMVQIMTRHVLGHNVSHQTRIKLVKVHPAKLTGKNPLASRIRELTGCSVVAIERQGQLVLNIDSSFELSKEDAIYICGSADAVNRYYDEFPTSQM